MPRVEVAVGKMTAAERVLRERLEGGPVGFDQFMDVALYDPGVGFYATTGRAGGRRGDFITSPETGPLFGVVVGRFLDRVWHGLGEPSDFTFVDIGAGPGTLARTVLAAEPDCLGSLQIVCVEVSAAQRALHPEDVESWAALPDEPVTGVIFANELLDNLPVRIAQRRESEWIELVVTDDLQLQPGRPVDLVHDLAPESVVPVANAASGLVSSATELVAQGRVVMIDYGGSTTELGERSMEGWLRTYRGHERGNDPFVAIGEQDITTDVPFDQLPTPTRQVDQAAWLAELGLDELVKEGRDIWTARAGVGDLEALKARSRINEAEALSDPDGLGGFTVLEWVVG